MNNELLLFGSLPWYDLPATAPVLDRLWSTIRQELTSKTRFKVATTLERNQSLELQWSSPGLLLSQCCGPDLYTRHGQSLRVIGRPILPGLDCEPGDYYSYIVAAKGSSISGSPRIAVNGETSWSGHLSLRQWLREQQLVDSDVQLTGSHEESLNFIRSGIADVAAIDAFSFQFLDTSGVSIIGRSKTAPSPPFVCHKDVPVNLELLQEVLGTAIHGQSGEMFAGTITCESDTYASYQPQDIAAREATS